MLSTFLQAFLLTCCSSLALPANQTEVVVAKTTTSGDVNMTQVVNKPHLTEVTNSTTDSGGQRKNSSTDPLIDPEGQSKNSSDNDQAKKTMVDPLVMIPERLAKNSSDNNNNKSNKEANTNDNKSNKEANNNDNNNNKKKRAKEAADPLAMMPESLTDAGGKARLWLNQNNQMVTCLYIRILLMPSNKNTTFSE